MAQWLNGSMAQWLNGSMAQWLNLLKVYENYTLPRNSFSFFCFFPLFLIKNKTTRLDFGICPIS
jgi:hypothetical protein